MTIAPKPAMLSMTGFATKTALLHLDQQNKVNISLSLKSLNSRFFEVSCKLPFSLNHLEHVFIKLFKKQLHRGHIYFTIYMPAIQNLKIKISPALSTIEGYQKAITEIQHDMPTITGSLNLEQLLLLPNIFTIEEEAIDETFEKQIIALTEELIDQVIESRKKEGLELAQDLLERFQLMEKEMTIIEQEFTRIMEQQKIKVQEGLQEIEAEENQLADLRKNALYAFLDKIDIHEEIVRFKSHLINLNDQFSMTEPEKGKRLDFTLQELAREINTITAKCSDISISSRAITIKVELEKAREQVQNIV